MMNRYGFLEQKELPWQIDLVSAADRAEVQEYIKEVKLENERGESSTRLSKGRERAKSKKKEKKKKKKKEKNKMAAIKEKAKQDLIALKQDEFPFLFNLTIDPKSIIKDFVYEKITVFNSKKVPLLITALNAQPGGGRTQALFKNGDDLRQDILTLQIISIMDKIWLAHNLDLKMTPYKVIGTDCMQGFLEFVQNCNTLAEMQYRGKRLFSKKKEGNIFNTFKDDQIMKFMRMKTKDRFLKDIDSSQLDSYVESGRLQLMVDEHIAKMREVFAKSTAGYCVANYILGLGDRHPDNIMINVIEGNFLHIDFGHFLGHVKSKFGIKRERDPFVLTPEIAYFINGGPIRGKWYRKKKKFLYGNQDGSKTINYGPVVTEVQGESSEDYGDGFNNIADLEDMDLSGEDTFNS